MKRVMCLLLVSMLVLGLCACGAAGGEAGDSVGLQVGYAREDITPKEPVPLDGYGNSNVRISTGTLDPLYVTCVAIKDGEETLLLITLDMLSCKDPLMSGTREAIAEKTGVPKDKIMITCTHTHSCPDVLSSHSSIPRFLEQYFTGIEKAAVDAVADLAAAKLYTGKVKVENMTFVRHYLMNDGTYCGSNFGSASSGYKEHATVNDPDMILVKAEREGDKKDILMMNWGSHPCLTGGTLETNVSADYIGSIRAAVERDSDMLFAFYQGAAGNQNTDSLLPSETNGVNNYIEYGDKLCKIALDAIPDLKPVEGNGIKTYQLYYEADVNHAEEHLLAQAQQVKTYWDSTRDRPGGNALAVSLGLQSVYHANSIIGRMSRPQTMKMELNTISIGDMAIAVAPFEMFSNTAIHIKENSPFDTTMIFTISNGNYIYLPTKEAFDYNCYEVNVGIFARGVAELTGDKFVEMLGTLKN